MASPDIAVIGGSGLYTLLDAARRVSVSTPYGAPSDEIAIGRFAGREVAFLARHGAGHTLPPHRVNHRANLWALARLGVRAVLATAAVGSLQPSLEPGALVVPDQLLDRSGRRDDTFFDGPDVCHLAFADPFCPQTRQALIAGLRACGEPVVDRATTAVIPGPRFSTRAESRALRAAGADLVNMTQYPEAALAAELDLGYASLCIVTDRDTDGAEPVTAEVVLGRLADARPRLVAVLEHAVRALPAEPAPRGLVDSDAVRRVLARDAACPTPVAAGAGSDPDRGVVGAHPRREASRPARDATPPTPIDTGAGSPSDVSDAVATR
ncbi:S-methyl-5'-thioadenosine phosphorylase [Microbacterium luticocti]|uniref:S-methyl-5'-thioadenosine phosphorylase n=1 Tax=Microbacterium luticocti TaxID=451764 RepID=UPI000400117C|nr:S-methyl-5'-thioadenosine phosphorylase [Microbacterium luticocti]